MGCDFACIQHTAPCCCSHTETRNDRPTDRPTNRQIHAAQEPGRHRPRFVGASILPSCDAHSTSCLPGSSAQNKTRDVKFPTLTREVIPIPLLEYQLVTCEEKNIRPLAVVCWDELPEVECLGRNLPLPLPPAWVHFNHRKLRCWIYGSYQRIGRDPNGSGSNFRASK